MLPVHVTTWGGSAGRGDPVILIHGTLSWGRLCWAGHQELAARRRLLEPDRRGFGVRFLGGLSPLAGAASLVTAVIMLRSS